MKALFQFIEDVFDTIVGPGSKRLAKRTLCCDVLMWDLWMHAPSCPTRRMPTQLRADNCPDCDFPRGFYGIYTRGEPCAHCGYTERRP